MARVLHIALKDIRIWVRDISAMGILLGMPIVLIVILGGALGGAGTQARIPVAVVNLDEGYERPGVGGATGHGETTRIGEELVATFIESPRLKEVFKVQAAEKAAVVRSRVRRGDLAAALIIPADFSARVGRGEPVELEVLRDPGSKDAAGIFESVVRSLAARYSEVSIAAQTALGVARTASTGATLSPAQVGALQGGAIASSTAPTDSLVRIAETEATRGVELTALDFYGVSMTAMFLMFGAMFGAFSTIKERREQTMSRLRSTPTSAMAITGGKMLGTFALGMTQFCVLYLFTRYAFGVSWGRDTAAIFAIAAAEMLAVTGLAVVIAALARTERGAGGIGPLVIQIQALLGGAFFSIEALPEWMQPIRFSSVIGWAIEGWQTVQLDGGTLTDVLGPVGALLAFAAGLFALGAVLSGVRR